MTRYVETEKLTEFVNQVRETIIRRSESGDGVPFTNKERAILDASFDTFIRIINDYPVITIHEEEVETQA